MTQFQWEREVIHSYNGRLLVQRNKMGSICVSQNEQKAQTEAESVCPAEADTRDQPLVPRTDPNLLRDN